MAFQNHLVTHEFPQMEITQGPQNLHLDLVLVADTLADEAQLQWSVGGASGFIDFDRPTANCVVRALRGGFLDSKRSRRIVRIGGAGNHIVVHRFERLEATYNGRSVHFLLELTINTFNGRASLRWTVNRRPKVLNIDNDVAECVAKGFSGAFIDTNRSRAFV